MFDNKCELLSLEILKFNSIQNCLINVYGYGACEFENNQHIITAGGATGSRTDKILKLSLTNNQWNQQNILLPKTA